MAVLNPDALREEVWHLLVEWFAAVKQHDRGWFDQHLATEYANWLVPEGKALTRAEYINVAMATAMFDAEFVDLYVEQTADYIVALYRIVMLRQLPDPASVDNDTLVAMTSAGVHDIDQGSKRRSAAYSTVIRRSITGHLQVVHHVFLGFAAEVGDDA